MTRPIEYTEATATAILDALTDWCHITDATALAGIARSTFYEWMRRGKQGEKPFESFRSRVLKAIAAGRREAFSSGSAGNVPAPKR